MLNSNTYFVHRPVTNGAQGSFAPPGKMIWTKFKSIGHSVKALSPSQKLFAPPWRPKLVTSLFVQCKNGKCFQKCKKTISTVLILILEYICA